MPKRKRDNSTFPQKVALRQEALRLLYASPVIMETHGGVGKLFDAVYAHVERGVVFEKDADKTAVLGKQRPSWAVYEADCVTALQEGVGGHLAVNFLDIDPYGECWPVVDAFFGSKRPFADYMVITINDGLRQSLALGKAWAVGSMQSIVARYGNDIHNKYLDVCQVLLKEKAAMAGYSINRFHGYYCGYSRANTHFMAVLERGQS